MRPVSPGEVLREHLDELNMSANVLAAHLQVPTNRITGILNETRTLTADTALRLEKFFGSSAQFWLNLQTGYDLRKAEIELGNSLRGIRPLKVAEREPNSIADLQEHLKNGLTHQIGKPFRNPVVLSDKRRVLPSPGREVRGVVATKKERPRAKAQKAHSA